MLLKGKTAVITGCNRGIGREILIAFAKNGADIWACVRKPNEEFENLIKDLSEECKVTIKPIYFELTNSEEMKEAIKKIRDDKRPIDILVNNAGITYNALFQMTSMENLKETFNVNYFAPMQFTQYISKLMLRYKKGSIISIASSAALDANPGRSAYAASKAALLCSTRVIAAEFGEMGIRANVIAPGITDTAMVGESMSESVIAETIDKTMLKRMGQPSDIANAALFLASDLSSYITGQVFRIDGGLRR